MTQTKPGMKWFAILLFSLAVTPVLAQQQNFNSIQEKFSAFSKQSSGEKVFVHTDKENYVAGEIIWFKLYVADAGSLQSSSRTKVGYVELIDRTQKPVLQAKIEIPEKSGAGSFYLPTTLRSDNYLLRAYTGNMKTNANEFFEKQVAVINTIKLPESSSVPATTPAVIQFFPEGGNLVAGIEAKVAFHISDPSGKGLSGNGILIDQDEDTVLTFSAEKFGIGSFNFTPRLNDTYRAIIQQPGGKALTKSLPSAYENGYVMNVTDNRDGRFRIRVQARGKDNGKRGENVFLIAHARQKNIVAEMGYVNYENELLFYVEKNKLPAGVSYFTLFNAEQRPVCERLVFTQPTQKAYLTVTADKNTYEVRQQVNVSIASDSVQKNGLVDYSLSVFKIDSLYQAGADDLVTYLFLTSDLAGEVESPGYYLSGNASEAETDNLMMTHGWRRFQWENVLTHAGSSSRSYSKARNQIISAKILTLADQKPAAGVDCILSFAGTPFGLYNAKSDANGIVHFDVAGYYGPGEIVIQAGRDTVNRYRVDVLTPFAEVKTRATLPVLSFKKEDEGMITARSIAMQAQNIYLSDSMGKFNPPALKDTFPFFGVPEFTYRLDDYKRFTTMEEVLREYVRPVNVVARNGGLYMRIFDELYYSLFSDGAQSVYGDNTLVLLDGVPIMNYNKMFSYDPLKIKKLDVVPRRYMLGGVNFKGIVSFESYRGKFEGFELTPGVVAVDYEGLQLQREFYSPAYTTAEQRLKRVPDFRSTLLWSPNNPVAKDGKSSFQFYTSDLDGKYLVLVQGFDATGAPVSGTTSFLVEQ